MNTVWRKREFFHNCLPARRLPSSQLHTRLTWPPMWCVDTCPLQAKRCIALPLVLKVVIAILLASPQVFAHFTDCRYSISYPLLIQLSQLFLKGVSSISWRFLAILNCCPHLLTFLKFTAELIQVYPGLRCPKYSSMRKKKLQNFLNCLLKCAWIRSKLKVANWKRYH